MAPWLAAAMRLLAGLAAGAVGGGLATGSGGVGTDLADNNPFIPDFIERLLPGERFVSTGRRRRRRRALTASDRADIAFIAGMISKAAAKDFAVQLAARPR